MEKFEQTKVRGEAESAAEDSRNKWTKGVLLQAEFDHPKVQQTCPRSAPKHSERGWADCRVASVSFHQKANESSKERNKRREGL